MYTLTTHYSTLIPFVISYDCTPATVSAKSSTNTNSNTYTCPTPAQFLPTTVNVVCTSVTPAVYLNTGNHVYIINTPASAAPIYDTTLSAGPTNTFAMS